MPTLLLLRHAKSAWPHDEPDDRRRDLAPRGRRQAPAVGRWLQDHGLVPQLAVVSDATRASNTWALVAPELDAQVEVRNEPGVYTFSGDDLLEIVQGLSNDLSCVAIVGHNPAMEELIDTLTGRSVRMVTSALAVIELTGFESAGDGSGTLRAAGRPASEEVALSPAR